MSLGGAVVLVVDPDTGSREALGALLSGEGARAVLCEDTASALDLLQREPADVLLADLGLAATPATSLLRMVGDRGPGLPVIVIAGGPPSPVA